MPLDESAKGKVVRLLVVLQGAIRSCDRMMTIPSPNR